MACVYSTPGAIKQLKCLCFKNWRSWSKICNIKHSKCLPLWKLLVYNLFEIHQSKIRSSNNIKCLAPWIFVVWHSSIAVSCSKDYCMCRWISGHTLRNNYKSVRKYKWEREEVIYLRTRWLIIGDGSARQCFCLKGRTSSRDFWGTNCKNV